MELELAKQSAEGNIDSAKDFLSLWRKRSSTESFGELDTMGYLLGAYDFLGRAVTDLQDDRFADWRASIEKVMHDLLPAIQDQVRASITQFNEERKELLESRETREKRFVTARRSVEILESYIAGNDWDSFPPDCRTRFFQSIEAWKAVRDTLA